MKKHLPNILTLGNAFCGCLGIVQLIQGNWLTTAILVGIALVCDFADGFVARALKVHSELGKQLDSLADAITFGVLPAFISFTLIVNTSNESAGLPAGDWSAIQWWHYGAFMIAMFSVLRLAKFNIDTRQSDSFIGVPTPANAILWTSFIILIAINPHYKEWIYNLYILLPLTLVMSFLLVAELPLFALKFKSFGWSGNQIKYIFLILSIVLLILLKYLALPLIILSYIVLSIIHNLLKK